MESGNYPTLKTSLRMLVYVICSIVVNLGLPAYVVPIGFVGGALIGSKDWISMSG